jgi:UDPglucose 6-dehydrogenase
LEICVVGTGYVGLVTGTCLAYLGRSVTCVDKDERKIAMLTEGQSPIYEPGLEPLLTLGQQRGLLSFSTDLPGAVKRADIIFVAVGTPPLASGRADLSAVEAVARQVGLALDGAKRRVIVNKSTVPIGSGNCSRPPARRRATCSSWRRTRSSCAKARRCPTRSTPTA